MRCPCCGGQLAYVDYGRDTGRPFVVCLDGLHRDYKNVWIAHADDSETLEAKAWWSELDNRYKAAVRQVMEEMPEMPNGQP